MIANQQEIFNANFIAGLLPRDAVTRTSAIDKVVILEKNTEQVKVKVGEPVYLGKRGEKQYKLILEEFSKGMVLLKTIDISHGVGYVVIKKEYIETKEKEITATI